MQHYPKHILRCHHIKVNGTQCGSPALKDQRHCFFHQAHRPRVLRMDRNLQQSAASITLPVLEDANSIQVVVMQVTRLLLSGQIDHKTAALTLYALQIASSNLARLSFEADKPTRIVVDCATVADTPLGYTPWSAHGKAHDSESGEEEQPPQNTMARILLHHFGYTDEDIARMKRQEEGGYEETDEEDAPQNAPAGDIQACCSPV